MKNKLICSGETALAEWTMFSEPKIKTYAISKREWNLLKEAPETVSY
ncbi:MAG: hypothetical protein ACLKAK_02705 [Alkaliphilus sp.]